MPKLDISKEELVDLLSTNSATKIGKLYGVSTTTVTSLMKKYGIDNLKKQIVIKLDENEIVELYKTQSIKSIASIYSVGYRVITKIIKLHNIKIKQPGIRTFNINEDVFKSIDTPQKAYWLGFLLADGHLTKLGRVKITLAKYDQHVLYRWMKFLGCEDPPIYRSPSRNPQMSVGVQSKKIKKDLESKGFHEFKDGTNQKILQYIPENIFSHFVRGYFDGDGSISYRRVRLTDKSYGNKLSWTSGIASKYNRNLDGISNIIPIDSIIQDRNDGYYLLFTNKSNCRNLGSYIYDNCDDLYIDRKKVRFDILNDRYPFYMRTIHDFHIPKNIDRMSIVDQFTECVLRSGWKSKKNKFDDLLKDTIEKFDNIYDNDLKVSTNPDSELIEHCQPWINWVSLNNAVPIAEFRIKPSLVRRAVVNFLKEGPLNPARLIREMRHVGFSRASLFSAATVIRVIRRFGLDGTWFDPCAGWGNRLLAANYLDIQYIGCDPGISFKGLEYLNKKLNGNAILHNYKWQDCQWPIKCDFIFTSPPFHNKENYRDNVDYKKFPQWCDEFIKPLVERSKIVADRSFFHVDERIKDYMIDFGGTPHELKLGGSFKTSKEFIVEY